MHNLSVNFLKQRVCVISGEGRSAAQTQTSASEAQGSQLVQHGPPAHYSVASGDRSQSFLLKK
jgi:hypothetical protein